MGFGSKNVDFMRNKPQKKGKGQNCVSVEKIGFKALREKGHGEKVRKFVGDDIERERERETEVTVEWTAKILS